MKLSLVVHTEGKASGQVIPVNLAQFIIGRDPQCNLRPASALISKRHCALLVREGEIYLRDFDSTNGTFLNEAPVKGEVRVKNNDVLRVGPLQFKVAVEASKVVPAKANPTPVPAAKPAAAAPAAKPAKIVSSGSQDDDIADLLLALPGDEMEEESTSANSGIPSGSTVMDLKVPSEVLADLGQDEAARGEVQKGKTPQPENKPDAKKEDKKVDKKADPAHMAAKAILDKYSRRGRG